MKPIPLIAALLILAGGLPARGQVANQGGDAEQNLKRLEREWGDAIVKHDMTAVDHILAEDYVLTTPEGRLVTKAQVLEVLRSPRNAAVVFRGVDLDDISARVYGETAVVSSRFTLKGRTGGRDVETPFRHTDVFVKLHGRWRCVARQATRIAESYGPEGEGAPGRGGAGAHRATPPHA